MDATSMKISVFTKPWKSLSTIELINLVKSLGFDGIEFPLRDGFQVDLTNMADSLSSFAEAFTKNGLQVMSVAAALNEPVFAACSAAKVPVIRIMLEANLKKGYLRCESEWVEQLRAVKPFCERYGVRIGIQPHFGPGISNTMELRHLLEKCDSAYICAIWDAAHSALAGEEPEQALDIIWKYLYLVNMKAAYYEKDIDSCSGETRVTPVFTRGRDGASSWPRIINYLKARDYERDICMSAEYSQESDVEDYIRTDLKYLKELLG